MTPRRILASLALVALVAVPLLVVAGPASAAPLVSTTIDGVTYSGDPGAVSAGATVTGYAPGALIVVIPSTVVITGTTFTVKTVGAHAFQNLAVTSVTLPSTITTVQDWAFDSMHSLTTINYPDALVVIGQQAFSNDDHLPNPAFGPALESIGFAAFANSPALTNVTIPASVTFIGTYAFGYDPYLVSVTFAGAVTTISTNAFFSNENRLANVTFQAGVPGTVGAVALGNGNPLVSFSCAFAAPAAPGGFTAPTWQGYRSVQAVPCPAPPAVLTPALTAPAKAAAGGNISVSGSGLVSSATYTVELHSTPVVLGTVTTSASGTFSASFVIPQTTTAGAHQIVLLDPSGTGVAGSAVKITAQTVLAATGATAEAPSALAAVTLLLAGAALLMIGMRRRRAV